MKNNILNMLFGVSLGLFVGAIFGIVVSEVGNLSSEDSWIAIFLALVIFPVSAAITTLYWNVPCKKGRL